MYNIELVYVLVGRLGQLTSGVQCPGGWLGAAAGPDLLIGPG